MIYFPHGQTPDDARPCVLYDNQFTKGAITSGSVAGENFLANIAGPQTFDFWKPNVMPAAVQLTFASLSEANMLAITAHDLGSKGAAITLRHSATTSGGLVSVGTFVPASDEPFAVIFPTVSAIRWRLEFAAASPISVGLAMIGQRLILPTAVTGGYVPLDRAKRVEIMAGNSLGGQMFAARPRQLGGDAVIGFNPVPRAWVDDTLPPFANAYDRGDTFFFASSPALVPNDLAYMRRAERAGELRPTWRDGGRWADMRFEVQINGA